MIPRRAFLAGLRDMAPILLGVAPFGVIAGAAAVETGLTSLEAMGLSLIVFAGAAQLAMLELMGQGAPLLIVAATAIVVNVRFVMYSAWLAERFSGERTRWRAALAYLITDQAYAIAVRRFAQESRPLFRRWYFLGGGLGLWATWQLASSTGIVLGRALPEGWSLDFAIPLTFLALLLPTLRDRAGAWTAVVAGGAVIPLAGLPANLGLLAAILAGLVAGALVKGGS